jgi:hypothetical protein
VNSQDKTMQFTIDDPKNRRFAVSMKHVNKSESIPGFSDYKMAAGMTVDMYDIDGTPITDASDTVDLTLNLGYSFYNVTNVKYFKYDPTTNTYIDKTQELGVTMSGKSVFTWSQSSFSDWYFGVYAQTLPWTVGGGNSIVMQTYSYLNQNANIYTNLPSDINYDYQLVIDLSNSIDSLNNLFNDRHYQQDPTNEDNYLVQLSINMDWLYQATQETDATLSTGFTGCETAGIDANPRLFGTRLLEVLAIKIFGHGMARAAIANDSDFYSVELMSHLANSMNNALYMDNHLFFNEYVSLRRTIIDDVSNEAEFNLYNMDIAFPVRLQGSLDPAFSESLGDGPYVGGNRLVNGKYSVPLSVIFKTTK